MRDRAPVLRCRLIKEFEHEARADGMPTELFQERRRVLVNGLNGFIAQKNELKQLNADRGELMSGAQQKEEEDINSGCMAGLHAGG